ncbi:MAG TPA: hypothetical protein VIM26_19605 [Pengzhenrongella sp.]
MAELIHDGVCGGPRQVELLLREMSPRHCQFGLIDVFPLGTSLRVDPEVEMPIDRVDESVAVGLRRLEVEVPTGEPAVVPEMNDLEVLAPRNHPQHAVPLPDARRRRQRATESLDQRDRSRISSVLERPVHDLGPRRHVADKGLSIIRNRPHRQYRLHASVLVQVSQ